MCRWKFWGQWLKRCFNVNQFLFRQATAYDEASARLLQILLFLLLSTASLMFIPCAVRFSFTLFIHFFGCLSLLLVPSTCPYSATAGSLPVAVLGFCVWGANGGNFFVGGG